LSAFAASRVEAVPERALSAVAWTAILSASGLVEIVWRVGLGGHQTVWIAVVQFGVLLLLLGLVRTWRAVQALTALVSALAALVGGFVALFLLERATGFTAWADGGPQYQVIPAKSALLCLPTLVMLAVALGFGFRRRHLFLAQGDVHAPSRIPGTSRRLNWSRLGPLLMLLFTVPLCVQLALTTPAHVNMLTRVGELLPLGIGFAAVNAAQEELRFRAVPLALAVPIVGGERGIWMTATAFGLGHWFGHPSGASGVALTMAAGLFLAKAMLETRGLLWPWALHAVQDVLIFAFFVLGSD
jgi:membrane protease YdiL (CAAX protease family)